MNQALILAKSGPSFHHYWGGTDVQLRQILSPVLSIAGERDDPENISAEELERYGLVVLYCPGTWGFPGDSPFITGLITYLVHGGRLLILHVNCLGMSPEGGAVFGGRFCMHPPYGLCRIIPAGGQQDPIFHGVADFYVQDEMHMHYMDPFLEQEVLLWCESAGAPQSGKPPFTGRIPHQDIYAAGSGLRVPAAWRFRYGAGKVLYVCPGHSAQSYREENLRRFLRNGTEWLLA